MLSMTALQRNHLYQFRGDAFGEEKKGQALTNSRVVSTINRGASKPALFSKPFPRQQLRYSHQSNCRVNAPFIFNDSKGRRKELNQNQVQREVFELVEFCEN